MNRVFQVEFKRGFYSIGFYIGIIILVIGGMIGAGDIVEYMSEVDYLGEGIRFMEAVCQAMRSEAFTFLLPVVCTLSMSASYLEDLQSGTLHYVLLRTTKRRYKWSKVLNCGLFGGLVVAAAILFLLGISFVRYPISGAEIDLWKMLDVTYYLYFLQTVLILWLNGSFYALLGGVIAAFVNNRYMAYAAPFIFYYVASTLFDAYLANIWMINPKEWMIVRLSSPAAVLTILLILNGVTIVGYLKIIERRGKND